MPSSASSAFASLIGPDAELILGHMANEQTSRQFVSADEIAAQLGVKAAAVRRWARRGSIPKLVLPGGRYVFDPSAVIAVLRERSATGAGSNVPDGSFDAGRH